MDAALSSRGAPAFLRRCGCAWGTLGWRGALPGSAELRRVQRSALPTMPGCSCWAWMLVLHCEVYARWKAEGLAPQERAACQSGT